MNSKLMKASLAGVAAIAVTAGGSTFAAFSDFSESGGNSVGAGVLKMSLTPNTDNPGDSLTFDNLKLAPGQYYERQAYVATNDASSTPDAKLFLDIANLKGAENGCDTNSEETEDLDCDDVSGAGELLQQATLSVNSSLPGTDGKCSVLHASSGGQVLPSRTWKLSQLINSTFPPEYVTNPVSPTFNELELTGAFAPATAGVVNKPVLAPGEGMCVLLTVALPNLEPTATALGNNAAQGDDVSFDLKFIAKQASTTYGSNSNYFVTTP